MLTATSFVARAIVVGSIVLLGFVATAAAEAAFAIDRVKALAPEHPEWNARSPPDLCLPEMSRRPRH